MPVFLPDKADVRCDAHNVAAVLHHGNAGLVLGPYSEAVRVIGALTYPVVRSRHGRCWLGKRLYLCTRCALCRDSGTWKCTLRGL